MREQQFDPVEVMRRLTSGDTAALQQIMEIFWDALRAHAWRTCTVSPTARSPRS